LLLLAKMISTAQKSSIPDQRRESRSPESLNAKHLRLILLQGGKNNLSGMILLQEATAPACRANIATLGNSNRICMFREMSVQERHARKSLRMICLQNHKNKPFGMILLQKKVGGGWCGALLVPNPLRRERYGDQELRGDHKDIRSFSALTLRGNVMDIRSFPASTKSA
jgi:hypothetical protein